MKGLILKDLYCLLSLYKKNLLVLFLLYAVMAIVAQMEFILTIFVWMMGFYSLSSFSLDDKSGWNRYARTLPVETGQIIGGKFIVTLLFILSGTFLALIIEYAGSIINNSNFDATIILLFASLSVITMGIMIPSTIKLGREKARYTLIAIVALFYAVPALLSKCYPELPTRIAIEIGDMNIIKQYGVSLFAIVVGVYLIGYIISCRIYNKKEF